MHRFTFNCQSIIDLDAINVRVALNDKNSFINDRPLTELYEAITPKIHIDQETKQWTLSMKIDINTGQIHDWPEIRRTTRFDLEAMHNPSIIILGSSAANPNAGKFARCTTIEVPPCLQYPYKRQTYNKNNILLTINTSGYIENWKFDLDLKPYMTAEERELNKDLF